MRNACSSSVLRPNLSARRSATQLGGASRIFTPSFESSPTLETRMATEGPAGVETTRKKNDVMATEANSRTWPEGSPTATVKLCNFCGQQGWSLASCGQQGTQRCSGCRRVCYCSVSCQTKDWNAHRHMCKPDLPKTASETLQEPLTPPKPVGQAKPGETSQSQLPRIYLHELPSNEISKGAQVQASVVELCSPGKFFIHVQSVTSVESLRSVTMALQKTYGGSPDTEYVPDQGEVCAVRYSHDQNWYRGVVCSESISSKAVRIFYIDFGNEETVSLDQVKPLATSIDSIPPCAVQCQVAGVTPLTDNWSEECCIAVRQLVAGKSLEVTVVDTLDDGAIWAVDVRLTTVEADGSVRPAERQLRQFLVEQGYGSDRLITSTLPKEQDIDSILSAALENFRQSSSGGKRGQRGAVSPEPLTQVVGDRFPVVVTHLQSPEEIICQKVDNASMIEELQVNLRDHCSRSLLPEEFRPAPGAVCCSQFSEDNRWYRAKVLGYSSEDSVCVGYIDFGNSEEVHLSRLRPISAELLSLPMQAIPCALPGVKPVSGRWSDEAVLTLKKLLSNRFLQAEILGKRGGVALVSLTDRCGGSQIDAAELLIDAGLALVVQPESGPDQAVESAVAKMEWACQELPVDGQLMELVASLIVSPEEFYCRRDNAEDLRSLVELGAKLASYCQRVGTAFTVTVGEPCCVLSPDDKAWYRGLIRSVSEGGKAAVFLVDYGKIVEVDTAHLRPISQAHLAFPFQAVPCWLAGVAPVGSEWSLDALQRFRALCGSQRLQARVRSVSDRGYGLELESGRQSVAALLVAEKLARDSSSSLKDAAVEPEATVTADRSFPKEWRTVKLTQNETFQPNVAALVSPSLFYVLNRVTGNTERVQSLTAELTKLCRGSLDACQSNPEVGAACSAQFSGDKKWYRAVVLGVTDSEADVLYADYGNVERLPLARVRPIAQRHLELPFRVIRCALAGEELISATWSPSLVDLFKSMLVGQVLASVQGFDRNSDTNLVVLTSHTEQGGIHINAAMLEHLRKAEGDTGRERHQPSTTDCKTTAGEDDTTEVKVDTKVKGETQQNKEMAVSMVMEQVAAFSAEAPSQADRKCCCLDLKQKVDQIEELLLQMMKQIGASAKP